MKGLIESEPSIVNFLGYELRDAKFPVVNDNAEKELSPFLIMDLLTCERTQKRKRGNSLSLTTTYHNINGFWSESGAESIIGTAPIWLLSKKPSTRGPPCSKTWTHDVWRNWLDYNDDGFHKWAPKGAMKEQLCIFNRDTERFRGLTSCFLWFFHFVNLIFYI